MLIGELMAPFFYAPTVGFIWLGVTIGVTVRGYYFFKLGVTLGVTFSVLRGYARNRNYVINESKCRFSLFQRGKRLLVCVIYLIIIK